MASFSEELCSYLKEQPYLTLEFQYVRDANAIRMSLTNSTFPSLESTQYISCYEVENIKDTDLPFNLALERIGKRENVYNLFF